MASWKQFGLAKTRERVLKMCEARKEGEERRQLRVARRRSRAARCGRQSRRWETLERSCTTWLSSEEVGSGVAGSSGLLEGVW